MKIYLLLKDTIITGYSYSELPETIEVEIENPNSIKLGIDAYVDGKIISNEIPAAQVKAARIRELKGLLAESDYLCLKHADGALSDEEYAETRAQRQAWRDEINSLEN